MHHNAKKVTQSLIYNYVYPIVFQHEKANVDAMGVKNL